MTFETSGICGDSTPSQTAWALMALVAAGAADTRIAQRAADWLCLAQREDGDWDEAAFTGTGFPGDFLIRYHLYRIVWPLLALGRYRTALADDDAGGSVVAHRDGHAVATER